MPVVYIVICIGIFGYGWCVGYNYSDDRIHEAICKQIQLYTPEYLECKDTPLKDVVHALHRCSHD